MGDRYEILEQAQFNIVTCTDCGVGPIMVIAWHDAFHERLDKVEDNAKKGAHAFLFG